MPPGAVEFQMKDGATHPQRQKLWIALAVLGFVAMCVIYWPGTALSL